MESDIVPETTAVEQPREPTMAQCAAHVLRVAGLAGTTGVRDPVSRQTTGVIDMSEDADDSVSDEEQESDSDSDEEQESDKASSSVKEVVIVDDVDDDDDDDLPEAQASEPRDNPRPPEILGRGMRIRKQPQNYVPSMAGKSMYWVS